MSAADGHVQLLAEVYCRLNNMEHVPNVMKLICNAIGRKACLRYVNKDMTDEQFEEWWMSERNLYWPEK